MWDFNPPDLFPWPVGNLMIELVHKLVGCIDIKYSFVVTMSPEDVFFSLNPRKLVNFVEEVSRSFYVPIIEMPSKIWTPENWSSLLKNWVENIWESQFHISNLMPIVLPKGGLIPISL